MNIKVFSVLLCFTVFLTSCAVPDAQYYKGYRVQTTPQDPYIEEVEKVVKNFSRAEVEMAEVLAALKEVSSCEYTCTYQGRHTFAPSSPDKTLTRHFGDCKDLSLLLLYKLNSKNASYVVGYYKEIKEENGHVWLYLNHKGVLYFGSYY